MYHSIAIDGPAGAGKSTIARQVAKNLGYVYVDTGAMYRAIALYLLRNNISAGDTLAVSKACKEIRIGMNYQEGTLHVILNGEDVTPLIRTEAVGNMASASSVNRDVRLKLVELQRELAAHDNVIMDGRDIGTYVLPDADLKIYLTASSSVRAKRRFDELSAKHIPCSMEEIEKDIVERDQRDMTRDFAPLRKAEDAVLVDTSNMSIEEVVGHILDLAEKIHS